MQGEVKKLAREDWPPALREGGSLPGVVEADDLGTYVLKFRGAGQGTKALVAEAKADGVPVDEQLRTALIEVEVADAAVEVQELASWLATQVRAGEALAAHAALQSWMDVKAGGKPGKKSPRKVAARR